MNMHEQVYKDTEVKHKPKRERIDKNKTLQFKSAGPVRMHFVRVAYTIDPMLCSVCTLRASSVWMHLLSLRSQILTT